MNIFNTTELYTKMVKMPNFMCIYQNKKIGKSCEQNETELIYRKILELLLNTHISFKDFIGNLM